ncbi:MAG: hypothetical protein LBB48_06045 [Treponema sp.]|jgi:type VI protein secretion system component VasK|nr:hypothetical protein [Treponema sp.]
MNPFALFTSMVNYVKTTTMGKIILLIVVLVLFLIIVLPLIRRLKRRRIKEKETREIMKDLLTWRHLAQLVKGGGGHQKAKQELSDKILKINALLKQGFNKVIRKRRDLYANPWFVLVGEPRSGKSSLLEASDLELEPSAVERDATDDGKNSLPVRIWSGTKVAVCDISGKVFLTGGLKVQARNGTTLPGRFAATAGKNRLTALSSPFPPMRSLPMTAISVPTRQF